ncbi:MAG TPA: hypothetical protein VEL76_38490 [Gemmataceae bacterium]|nr:hypothetical protein [Gemmataceae bacterium]
MSEWERLRQGLQPELYRGNAFRVTNLAVDATLRDIDRQWKRLQMRQKLGSSAAEAAGLLPLTPPADLAAVREAVERLREPEKRFFDEFFWFWPAANDPALPALARGDFSAARTAWQTAAGPDAAGAVARHNLAVLMHVLALDLECIAGEAQPTSSVRAEQRDRCWAEALLAWKALLEQGEFWELVKERIRTRNEPQLKTDLAFHFREHLPVALLGINAQLALRAAERGAAADMARHKDILSRAGFDTAASTAVRLALKPIRARIQRLCQTEAGANQADNWRAGLLLFQRILPIPLSVEQRELLYEDVASAQRSLCWFCQRRFTDVGSEIRIWMHNHVVQKRVYGGSEVHWYQLIVDVPRCPKCYELHRVWDLRKMMGQLEPGVQPESEKLRYPEIERRLAEGWALGARPSGV